MIGNAKLSFREKCQDERIEKKRKAIHKEKSKICTSHSITIKKASQNKERTQRTQRRLSGHRKQTNLPTKMKGKKIKKIMIMLSKVGNACRCFKMWNILITKEKRRKKVFF